MAINFYSAINMNGNDIERLRPHQLSSAPSSPSPVSGQMYYNTTANTLHYHDGTNFIQVANHADIGSGAMSAFIIEDDDGTEVSVSNAEEIKFIGSGITTNWTDTSTGSDGDPFDLTFTVDAAQTGITSILATDLKIGEDNQTKIDFETADEIHFYAANVEQVYLADNIFGPQSDSDVDLGTTGVRWKDAYVDSITVTGEVDGATLDISGNADIAGDLTGLDNITSTNYIVGGHTIDDIDITAEFTDADAHIMSSKAIGARFAQKNADTTGTAAIATTVTITDNESTDEDNPIVFVAGGDVDGGNLGLETDGTAHYNPSTGKITATAFAGNLTGNVTGNVTGTTSLATVTNSTANTNFPVVFHDESNALLDDTGALRYNPSTGTLLVPNLNVAGTTTQVDTVTMNAANAVVFEGATADDHETTLTVVDPTVDDNTIYLPDATGYIPLIADASTADGAVTAAEFALLDGGSTVATGAFANGDGLLHNDGGTMKQTNVSSLATLFAGAGMTATSSVVNVIGGDGITANANDVAVTAAQTTITSVLNASLVVGRDADNDIDFGTDNNIIFRAAAADQIVLKDGVLEPVSDDDVDLGSSSKQFKNGYFDGTLEADALTIGGAAVLAQATATAVGAVELAADAEVLAGSGAGKVVDATQIATQRQVVAAIDVSSLTGNKRVTITHDLGTADVSVQLYDTVTEAQVFAETARTAADMSTASTTVVTVDFGATDPPNDLRAVITSLRGATASGTVAYA